MKKIEYVIQWQPRNTHSLNDWGYVCNGVYGGEVIFENGEEAVKFAKKMMREDKNSLYRILERTTCMYWSHYHPVFPDDCTII